MDYNKINLPSKEEMRNIGQELLNSLSSFLGVQLTTFKEHYVQEGSIVLTFRSIDLIFEVFEIQIEGVLLFDVRERGLPPSIDSEILVFSFGKRLGLQQHNGRSYVMVHFDVDNKNWKVVDWLSDAEEEWERITETRKKEYETLVETYDFE